MNLVLVTDDGPVRTITLNAPERLNALDLDLLAELKEAIADTAATSTVGAVVVTGAGRAFCAGADLTGMFGDLTRPTEEIRDHLKGVYASFLGLRDLAAPTIAAVQGPAIGAGLNIALACDVIIEGPRARFGPTFAAIGLHPGGGCSWMLVERIGRSRAMAALLEGALIDADRAHDIGLADSRADDPLTEANRIAALCAGRSELSRTIKRSVDNATRAGFTDSIDVEALAQAESTGSETFRRRLAEFAART
ncbi:enoyl-CoA hydratase-related protein [Gordonia alkanivorans]|uniref:enoyl-CoA hydratase-related protein n=1 Tax=Gordonia alkanivorans TaxID=84096 RepID=UPI0024469CE6|nr:enoyl-CoA hydratase-related protein [Gordonia alkanivorans]MDH3047225.1 enoyl-CoA hydratase-related protein [Gordonia alkanivorans]